MASMDFSILNEFKELMGEDGEAEVQELISLYLEDGSTLLGTIRQAFVAGEWDLVGRSAHSFKSSCGNVGALELQALCQELEQKAASGHFGDDDALITRIEAVFSDVKVALGTYQSG